MAIGPASFAEIPAGTAGFKSHVAPFFQENCIKCHGPEKQKGKVALRDFPIQATTTRQLEVWQKVHDALKDGDMPPDEEKQPTPEQRKAMVAWFAAGISQMQKATAPEAVATARRLSNFEYQNTMRDLLGIPLNFKVDLPEDPVKPYHFNNSAEFMLIGPEQIDRYLDTARRALDSVIVDEKPPAVTKKRAEWKSERAPKQDLAPNEIGVWESQTRCTLGIQNPPPTGEYRLRFRVAAKLLPGTKGVPLRFVMGQGLGVNSSTLSVAPTETVHLRSETPQEFELRGRIENFPVTPGSVDKGKILPPSLTITAQNLFDNGELNDNY